MTKLWEVDFAHISGSYYLDNIGSQHLTNPGGGFIFPPTVSVLPTMDYRPGMTIPDNDAVAEALDLTGITNAHMSNTYSGTNARSLELWIYIPIAVSDGSTSYWDASGNIWTEGSNFYIKRSSTSNYIRVTVGATDTYFQALKTTGWKHIVVTATRSPNYHKVYYNGAIVGSGSTVPSTSPATLRLGDESTSIEGNFCMGKAATYNTELTAQEVLTLYNNFLPDSSSGELVYDTVSGYVYNDSGNPIASVPVYLLSKDRKTIDNHDFTTSSGFYTLLIPQSGEYTVIAANKNTTYTSLYSLQSTATGVIFL